MKNRKLLFFGILFCYAFMYIATSKQPLCNDDCEKTEKVASILLQDKKYVQSVYRCTQPRISDTLCVFVKDMIGINWNLLADTTCLLATQNGLLQQKIFVLKGNYPYDTVARKICP
jgi:hypothetical protein